MSNIKANSPVVYNGKKEKLLPKIRPLYPTIINNYYEPFCGGASVFFDLHSQQIINGDYYLSDLNWRLLRVYKVIRDDLSGLLNELKNHCPNALPEDINFVSNAMKQANSLKGSNKKAAITAMQSNPQWIRLNRELEIYFYHLRAVEDKYVSKAGVIARIGEHNNSYLAKTPTTKTELAAKDLFLNRMTMNGWRENNGQFNLPYYDKRTNTPAYYYQPHVLSACSKVFNDPRVHIAVQDYLSIESKLTKGDFVYLDPPYAPASASANFTNYSCSFGQADQINLADFVKRIDKKGVRFLLSNSAIAQSLYTNFNIIPIKVRQYNNGNQPTRLEILVHN